MYTNNSSKFFNSNTKHRGYTLYPTEWQMLGLKQNIFAYFRSISERLTRGCYWPRRIAFMVVKATSSSHSLEVFPHSRDEIFTSRCAKLAYNEYFS